MIIITVREMMSKISPEFLYPRNGFPESRDEPVEMVMAETGDNP